MRVRGERRRAGGRLVLFLRFKIVAAVESKRRTVIGQTGPLLADEETSDGQMLRVFVVFLRRSLQ